MIGNNVEIHCIAPDEKPYGTLQRQDATGVVVSVNNGGIGTYVNTFIPTHRIVRIIDRGPVYR